MATEEEIKKLAHEIWEKEGRPDSKDVEHYFRAKQILELQEASNVIELAPPRPVPQLAPQPPITESAPPSKRKKSTRRKQK